MGHHPKLQKRTVECIHTGLQVWHFVPWSALIIRTVRDGCHVCVFVGFLPAFRLLAGLSSLLICHF